TRSASMARRRRICACRGTLPRSAGPVLRGFPPRNHKTRATGPSENRWPFCFSEGRTTGRGARPEPMKEVEQVEAGTIIWTDASCATGDARLLHLFFSEEPYEIAEAKAICQTCPLRIPCLEGAA